MHIFIKTQLLFLTLLTFLFLTGCSTTNQVYFTNQQDTTLTVNIRIPETLIQKNDLLGISVSSLNPEASAVFNAPNFSYADATTPSGNAISSSGYLVTAEGNIKFPILGTIKVAGLSTNQVSDRIVELITAQKLLIDAIVHVRHLNFKVTVLGEVGRPTVINVPNEKITMLEALGLAGDITLYGKKENVLIIREEENGKKTIKRINLNSSDLFRSDYYYLKSNDIIYVEPTKARLATTRRSTQLLPIILSGLSFSAIILDRLLR